MEIDYFFHFHPVFRYEEIADWKYNHGTNNSHAVRKTLLYYTKIGLLLNIRRGIYAVIPPGTIPSQYIVDSYLLASKIAKDSVLAYHTALEIHGVAYSIFQQFYFLTSQKIKTFEFQNQLFQPVAFPLALKKNNDFYYGVEELNRQGMTMQVTTLERTFVDVLDRIELSGGWEEVVRSISNMAILDINSVIHYCLMLNNRILAAKVGFFLEQRQGAFAVKDEILQPLLEKKPLTPQSLSNNQEETKLIKKWNLILPLNVVNKTWEEPNNDV